MTFCFRVNDATPEDRFGSPGFARFGCCRNRAFDLPARFFLWGAGLGFILIGFQLLLGWVRGGDAGFGNRSMSCPNNRIQNYFAEVFIGPVVVEMSSCKSESASAAVTFGSPANMLDLTVGNFLANRRIPTVGPIWSTHRVLGRVSRQNWRDTFHFVPETHVEIPLVVNGEWFHTVGNGVVRK